MQFIYRQRQFTLALFPIVLVSAMLLIMCKLAFWQLDRAAEKKALLGSVLQAQSAELESLSVLPEDLADWQYRKVELVGVYLTSQQFLLDNQFNGQKQDKRAGFDVLTPFLLKDNSIILINRGWLPRKQDKNDLPNISFSNQQISVKGIIRKPAKAFSLGQMTDTINQWPKLIQFVDLKKLGHYFDNKMQPVMLMLLPEEQNGYTRSWQTKHEIKMGPAVHYGYAFQWFALSFTLLILSITFVFKKSKKV